MGKDKKTEETETMILETKALLLKIVEESLKLPEPEEDYKIRIEECEKSELVKQKEKTVYEMRLSQFKSLGFYPFPTSQAVKLLKGEPHTKTVEQSNRQNYDYHYRHNEHTVTKGDKCTWGVPNPDTYVREESQSLWFLPPFIKKIKWTVTPVFKFDDFIAPLPGPLLTSLNYMRNKGFFNTYKGYQCEESKDAILLGCIAELGSNSNNTGDYEHFFLGTFHILSS